MKNFLHHLGTKQDRIKPMRQLILAFSICAVALFAQDAPKAAPAGPKNLKVLKATEVRGAMGMATSGLGVACTECHTADMSSDEKPAKVTARAMFEMTQKINAGFPGEAKMHVTCYTCHRGAKEPLAAAPKP